MKVTIPDFMTEDQYIFSRSPQIDGVKVISLKDGKLSIEEGSCANLEKISEILNDSHDLSKDLQGPQLTNYSHNITQINVKINEHNKKVIDCENSWAEYFLGAVIYYIFTSIYGIFGSDAYRIVKKIGTNNSENTNDEEGIINETEIQEEINETSINYDDGLENLKTAFEHAVGDLDNLSTYKYIIELFKTVKYKEKTKNVSFYFIVNNNKATQTLDMSKANFQITISNTLQNKEQKLKVRCETIGLKNMYSKLDIRADIAKDLTNYITDKLVILRKASQRNL